MVISVSFVLAQTMVSVLLMLILRLLLSSAICQSEKRVCIPASSLSATIRSSAYSICDGTSLLTCSDIASIAESKWFSKSVSSPSGNRTESRLNLNQAGRRGLISRLHTIDHETQIWKNNHRRAADACNGITWAIKDE